MLERYTDKRFQVLWSEEEKFSTWLKVELAFLRARAETGDLNQSDYRMIEKHASFDINRINELEAEIQHDMIAFVMSIQESLEKAGVGQLKEEFHKRLTSYDIEDPALVLMLRESALLIHGQLVYFQQSLKTLALKHKLSLMITSTHGQFAEPGTFGELVLVYYEQATRNMRRLERVIDEELSEGKISGAVGNYSGIDPKLERLALSYLDLKPAAAETQILQRDRHATYMSVLAIISSSIQQMAETFWIRMHSMVGELQEGRKPKQRGSSAMPQKRNPILTEKLKGMARLVRANLQASLENIATPEWRDISQSNVERHIFPDATSQTFHMLLGATRLVDNLVVNEKRMAENLFVNSLGVWATQRVRNAMMDAGVEYNVAYEYTQKCAFLATDNRLHLLTYLKSLPLSGLDESTAEDVLGVKVLDNFFDPVACVKSLRKGLNKMFRKHERTS